jgi:Uma2 family endonuclease
MATGEKPLTLEEFLALPEEEPTLEYADGVVTQKVSPRTRHSALQFELAERINRIARPRQEARAFPEFRVTFGGVSRVPDLSVFRWDRIPRVADGQLADDVFAPPDIAVEIVSPEQRVSGLVRRCLWYVGNGV